MHQTHGNECRLHPGGSRNHWRFYSRWVTGLIYILGKWFRKHCEEWIRTQDDAQQGHQLGNDCSGQIVEGKVLSKEMEKGAFEKCCRKWELQDTGARSGRGGYCIVKKQVHAVTDEAVGHPKRAQQSTGWIHYTLIVHLLFLFFLMFVLFLLFLPVHLKDREICLVLSWE